jgi:C4-dicarboxylate-specific signal transduction histidine kinase
MLCPEHRLAGRAAPEEETAKSVNRSPCDTQAFENTRSLTKTRLPRLRANSERFMPTDGAQQAGWSVPHERPSERAEHGRGSRLTIDSTKIQRALDETSRRRESEKTLRNASAEMTRASHLTVMASLAASIAHEINQPLTSVVSNAAAAIRWLSRDEPDIGEALSSLAEIKRNGKRAAEIVSALRSLARQTPATRSEVQVDAVIREVLNLTSMESESTRVNVEAELNCGPARVLADAIQLQQVLRNLVTNAIEAMNGVEEPARRLTVTSMASDGGVAVSVEDTGGGICPDVMSRIFDPFVTTKTSGMGMGLAICRSIIEAHGGSLTVTSSQGRGARFLFTLPLAPPS